MRVLLAIDGSPPSQAAVLEAAGLPWPKETEMEILTVIHPTIPLLTEPTLVIAAMSVQEAEEQRLSAPQLVQVASEQIRRGSPNVSVKTRILDGAPAQVIVEAARDWSADLIVVGSHGYGFMKRMLLGSVAGAVVANAPCSVHVVRSRSAADSTVSSRPVNPTL